MTTVTSARTFELMSTVTFPAIPSDELGSFASKLSTAVGGVLPDFPAVVAFVVEPDLTTGDINYGLRFSVIDPNYVEDMATEILEKAIERIAHDENAEPIEAEREESVLVLTR